MPEQLNERERAIAEIAFQCGLAGDGFQDVIDWMDMKKIPADPNHTRITELEAEVERLRGKNFALHREADLARAAEKKVTRECLRLNALLDVIEAVLLDDFDLKTERCEDILSRRTAERKERGDV